MEFDIEIHFTVLSTDIDGALEQYDKIYEMLTDAGYEPDSGEVGPAIHSELLE